MHSVISSGLARVNYQAEENLLKCGQNIDVPVIDKLRLQCNYVGSKMFRESNCYVVKIQTVTVVAG